MPKVNGHRYNIVCNSVQEREEITDETLFAIYYASDDRRYNTKDTNRVFDKVCTLSQLRDFLLYIPAKYNLRLRLRPRKTNKRQDELMMCWYKRNSYYGMIRTKQRRFKRNVDDTMPK